VYWNTVGMMIHRFLLFMLIFLSVCTLIISDKQVIYLQWFVGPFLILKTIKSSE